MCKIVEHLLPASVYSKNIFSFTDLFDEGATSSMEVLIFVKQFYEILRLVF